MQVDHADEVAAHYNAVLQLGLEGRQSSKVYHLRSLHNWIKSVLINQFTFKGHRVLDLCCGKGGDLIKWSKNRVKEVVGVDIAAVSIQQGKRRFDDLKNKAKLNAQFFVGDVFAKPLETFIGLKNMQEKFDVVSCQFAYHYSWETEAKARMGLENISKALRSGGHLLITTPNANWIV